MTFRMAAWISIAATTGASSIEAGGGAGRGLYGIEFSWAFPGGPRLVTLDPRTGEARPLGDYIGLESMVEGISTLDPVGRRFYFIGSFPQSRDKALISLDLSTGKVLDAIPTPVMPGTLEADPQSGALYTVFWSEAPRLRRLSSNGTFEPVGPPIPGAWQLPSGTSALDPDEKRFFVVLWADPCRMPGCEVRLFALGLEDGHVESSVPLEQDDPFFIRSIEYDRVEKKALVTMSFDDYQNNRILAVDPSTGQAETLAESYGRGVGTTPMGVSTYDNVEARFYTISLQRLFGVSVRDGSLLSDPAPVMHRADEAFQVIMLGFLEGPSFLRGDFAGDGRVDIADAIAMLGSLFLGGPRSSCDDASDADDSGHFDPVDAVQVVRMLFLTGTPLPPPFPACGIDPSADRLDCVAPGTACSG